MKSIWQNKIHFLRCPHCYGQLLFIKKNTYLKCQLCVNIYPVVCNVVDFIGQDNSYTQKAFSDQWRLHFSSFFKKKCFGFTDKDYCDTFLYSFNKKISQGLVIEAGIGSGNLLVELAKKFPKNTFIGIDFSTSVFKIGFENQDIKNLLLIRCDILKLPIKRNIASYVYSSGVIHHLYNPFKGVSNLFSLLKIGGSMYFWIYDAKPFCLYHELRTFFPKSFKYPYIIRRALAIILTIPFWLFFAISKKYSYKSSLENFATISFRIFDNLSPEFQFRFNDEKIHKWMNKLEISNYKIINRLGVLIKK